MANAKDFTYQIDYSEVPPEENLDSRGTKVTTIKCHGRLVAGNTDTLQEIFKNTEFRGRIVFDLSDVEYIDSSGLGALMRLKLSAIKEGGVSVTYVEMAPRVMQLLSLANLTQWFSS